MKVVKERHDARLQNRHYEIQILWIGSSLSNDRTWKSLLRVIKDVPEFVKVFLYYPEKSSLKEKWLYIFDSIEL